MLDTLNVLTTAPPALTAADAVAIAGDLYGIEVNARPLTGERDRNFLLKAAGSHGSFVMKIANGDESRGAIDFQLGALARIEEEDPALPVPRVVADCTGALVAQVSLEGRSHHVCVLTYLEGEPVGSRALTPAQAAACGDILGRIDRALEGYIHPAQDRALLWDICRAAEVRDHLDEIDDPHHRRAAHAALDRAEAVMDDLARLPRQVIHNDMNPHNVLTGPDGAISGLIDFGDILRAPRINDVATAASYVVGMGEGPLGLAPQLAGAWARHMAPTARERALLAPLMGARNVLTLGISAWRAKLHPQNRRYILRNVPVAVAALERLSLVTPDEAAALLWPNG